MTQLDKTTKGADGGLEKPSNRSQPTTTMSLPSTEELMESHKKWWRERADGINGMGGFGSRDLRNQEDLLNTVAGMEEDITFLLRYVRSLTDHIDLLATNSKPTPSKKRRNKEEEKV